ncbi:MAG: hypothetical protein IJY93_01155 [Clostridia bacterium]|nr:hypothetical protein [Clostridia bacterium]
MNHYDDNEYVYLSLLHLGVVRWNRSSKRLLRALQYVISNDLVIEGPVKCLYAELATAQKCTYGVIEHSLRYAIGRMWECSHTECSKLLYHSSEIHRCPSVSEFLCLYSDAFKRGIIQTWVDSLESEANETPELEINDILGLFTL